MRKASQIFFILIIGYLAWYVFEWSEGAGPLGARVRTNLEDPLRSVELNDAESAAFRLAPKVQVDNVAPREPVTISIGEEIYNADDPYTYPPQTGSMVNIGSFIDPDDPRHLTAIEQNSQSVGEFLDPDNILDYPTLGGRESKIGDYIDADLNNFTDSGSTEVVDLGDPIDPDLWLHRKD